jgi:hypothetical protein
MNRLTSGMVSLCALLLAVGCSGDPTESLRGSGVDKVVASPSQLFLELGQTKSVDVGAVDAQGNQLEFDYQVTSVGSGISVKRDSSFRGEFLDDSTFTVPPTALQFRFTVTSTAYGATSFTVSAGGEDLVIPVQVVAQNQIGGTLSTTTPALGDTITLTLDPGVTFSPTSEFSLAGGTVTPKIVERDPNGTFIRFLAPPNVNSGVTITEVTSTATPGLLFTPTTNTLLQTPFIDSVDVVFSTATPTIGQTVAVTLPPLIKFTPVTALTFPDQLAPPANVIVAADSLSLTFEAPPNATGPARIDSLVFPGDFALELPTRPTIVAENIGTTIAATFNTLTPAVNQQVTVTTPAGFSIDPAATVDFKGIPGEVFSRSGTSVTFTPPPGTTAPVNIAGVLRNATPQFNLTLPTTDTLVVPATVPAAAGTDNQATAPTVPTPGVGGTSAFYDAPDYVAAADHFYKLVVAAAGDYTITLDWTVGSDIDMFVCPAPVPADFSTCDFTAATGDHPESSTFTLAAGTYFVVADDFGADAAGTTLHISVTRDL